MRRKKLSGLIAILVRKIEKAQDFAEKTKHSADETAKTATTSWSAAGDREHTRGQATIALDNLRKLELILEEVKGYLGSESPSTVEPISFVKIKYKDGTVDEFYFLKNPIFLKDMKFVSPYSPFGESILGKQVGDKFDFGKGGEILSVE